MLHLAHDWVLNYFWVWARLYKWDRFTQNLPMLGLQPCFLGGALLALHKSPMVSKMLTSIYLIIMFFYFSFISTNRITPGERKDTPSEEWWDTGNISLWNKGEPLLFTMWIQYAPDPSSVWLCGLLSLRPWHVLVIVSKIRHPLLEAGKRVLHLGPL